jgi:hypothetical protein
MALKATFCIDPIIWVYLDRAKNSVIIEKLRIVYEDSEK